MPQSAYRLGDDGRYGAPELLELIGRTEVAALPGGWIDWPAPEAFDL
ncbi:hypothetical protein [Thermochromatium tepidum]|uniref:Uncharacterized protein n=1 Tax=Thermochromatium tepidum ATCC 43061 TaxID=316276 RepID=A0A6I6DWF3_THETI|nr:hypothetical protein [Thermochromatium tepidum]QGU31831.1 hypothetical protein E6P07_01845 [Thermochromatium tepidum ATCC 43061]